MVIGGQFFNASSRLHDTLDKVEVLGPRGSCQVIFMPCLGQSPEIFEFVF